jgi:hypothetical protein
MLCGRPSVHVGDQTCKRVAVGSKLLVLGHCWFWELVWYRLLPKNTLSINIENYWLDTELNVYDGDSRIFQENVGSIVIVLSWEPFPNYCTLCPFSVAKGRRVGSVNGVLWFCIVLLTHKDNGQLRSWGCFSDSDAVYLLVQCGYVYCVVREGWQLYISRALENYVGSAHLVWTNCGKFPLETLGVSQIFQKLSSSYGTLMFIAVFMEARHFSLY